MRQWLVNPKILCRQHLLGEHCEHHMFVGSINKNISVAGYLRDNLLEIPSLQRRHEELKEEMLRRGMNHNSDLPEVNCEGLDLSIKIDKEEALKELLRRCPECKRRYEENGIN